MFGPEVSQSLVHPVCTFCSLQLCLLYLLSTFPKVLDLNRFAREVESGAGTVSDIVWLLGKSAQ